MTPEEMQKALAAATAQLEEAQRLERRWKREAADAAARIAANRESTYRANALREIMFERGCTGLVFVGRKLDDPKAPCKVVIVPIAVLREEADSQKWPGLVEEFCVATLQAYGEPLEWLPAIESNGELEAAEQQRDALAEELKNVRDERDALQAKLDAKPKRGRPPKKKAPAKETATG